MQRMIFPNLPVRDVAAARTFWGHLGFAFNEDFCSAEAACLVINDQASVMLLQEEFFHGFHRTQRHTGTEALFCLTASSRDDVDTVCARAREAGAEAGGTVDQPPMYGGSFRDLDGHLWEVLWMETS